MWSGSREEKNLQHGEKHLGMGLYLAERIFRIHGMTLKVGKLDGRRSGDCELWEGTRDK